MVHSIRKRGFGGCAPLKIVFQPLASGAVRIAHAAGLLPPTAPATIGEAQGA